MEGIGNDIKDWLGDRAIFEANCSSPIQETLWKGIFKNRDVLKINGIRAIESGKQTISSLFDLLNQCSVHISLLEDIIDRGNIVAKKLADEEKKRNEEIIIANKIRKEQEAKDKLNEILRVQEEIYKNKFLDVLFGSEVSRLLSSEDELDARETSIDQLQSEYKTDIQKKCILGGLESNDARGDEILDRSRDKVLTTAQSYIRVEGIDEKTAKIERLSTPEHPTQ